MSEGAGKEQLQYTRVAALLHWGIAVLILLATGSALFRETFSYYAIDMIGFHKLVGISILALALVRLAWRLTHRPPRSLASVGRAEHLFSHSVHWLLYGLMIGVPLSGWIFVSYAPDQRPVDFRGPDTVFELPVAIDDAAALSWHEAHELAGFFLIGLLFLHAAGVVRHQFFKRDDIVGRMNLRRSPPNWPARVVGGLALLWLLGLFLDMGDIRLWPE